MANQTQLTLTPVSPLDFVGTARSHGWVGLAPNAWDEGSSIMRRVQRLSSGRVVRLDITSSGSVERPSIEILVSHRDALSAEEREELRSAVGRMFRTDQDLREFYALCRARGGRWLRPTQGLGRLLRSPALFEDVVKVICTTNIQWGGTRRMAQALVDTLGEPYPDDPALHAFPTPEALAAVAPETLADSVRLGYRTGYVHALATRVARGELDLDALATSDMPTPELRKALLAIKGVGNYAAASLLMLLDRYDDLAVDTAFRQFVSTAYFGGQRPPDAEAAAIYETWGRWKYLAYWFDIWQGHGEA